MIILDTNVLLHDPNSLLSFKDNNVLIPIEVIEEIDRFKRESSELGQNARTVSRMLDGLRGQGSLSDGVKLPNGGKLRSLRYSRYALSHSSRRKLSQVDDASNTAAVSFGCRSNSPVISAVVTQSAASDWKFCTLVRNECGTPEADMVRRTSSAPEYCSL